MITGMNYWPSVQTRASSSPASNGGNFQEATQGNDGVRPFSGCILNPSAFLWPSWRYGSGCRPITSFKTAWIKVRQKAGVKGRWHDNRHTLVTELAESGAGDEVIMSIAGHVSRAMLSRYSHVRMEAKRRALDEIAARQCN